MELGRQVVYVIAVTVMFAVGVAEALPVATYNPANGQLTVNTTDGTLLSSVVVAGPQALSIDRWSDGSFEDNATWIQDFFNNEEQWAATPGLPVGQSFVDPGTYQIATYEMGLGAGSFQADLEVGIQLDESGINPGATLFVPLTIATPSSPGDYDASSEVGLSDLNLVLFNWNTDGAAVPSEWMNERPDPGVTVGLTELNGVLFNWGNTALTAVVPEPASISLALVALVLGVTIKRRRR